MRTLLTHAFGTPFSSQALHSLSDVSTSCDVTTAFAYLPESVWARSLRILPPVLRRTVEAELNRRSWLTGFRGNVRCHPARELCRVAFVRSGLQRVFHAPLQPLTDWVVRGLDEVVAKEVSHGPDYSLIYGYEDGSASTFCVGKERGAVCLYDLPILHYAESARIQREELELFPEFGGALAAANEPSWKLERKQRELELADHVVVASSVTRASLEKCGYPSEKISVVPYGIESGAPRSPRTGRTFRVVFVGRVGPRKGVHYLLRAWSELRLADAELLLIGIDEFPNGWLARNKGNAVHYRSVPRAELAEFYRSADLLVLPSLVEGFGLVLLEAMAYGVPILATDHTAAPDIISDGVEGFIVRVRDVEALKTKLVWCYEHRTELREMGDRARSRSEQFSWKRYREQLASTVRERAR